MHTLSVGVHWMYHQEAKDEGEGAHTWSTNRRRVYEEHIEELHQGDTLYMEVIGIEKVTRPLRGGDWQKKIFMREAYWILKLRTRFPLGLNLRSDLAYIY